MSMKWQAPAGLGQNGQGYRRAIWGMAVWWHSSEWVADNFTPIPNADRIRELWHRGADKRRGS